MSKKDYTAGFDLSIEEENIVRALFDYDLREKIEPFEVSEYDDNTDDWDWLSLERCLTASTIEFHSDFAKALYTKLTDVMELIHKQEEEEKRKAENEEYRLFLKLKEKYE